MPVRDAVSQMMANSTGRRAYSNQRARSRTHRQKVITSGTLTRKQISLALSGGMPPYSRPVSAREPRPVAAPKRARASIDPAIAETTSVHR